ncbi:MAG: Gfo/Idh/MocA family oxidoreductase, partial [Chloroflexi bacterium]|nr:Gfo/Idh/MocA family oxidoreductase [Chloroflexota bacterium]
MTTYRAGIIGLRGIAANLPEPAPHPVLGIRTPYNHTAAYAQVPATELVAVCDIVPSLLDRFKENWGQRWPQAKTYTDYREMLAQARLDILSICTPDNLHADMVVAAAEAGVKGIICEKPLATTIQDAERMIAAVEKHGTKMAVEHTRRWIYEYHEAREMVRQGRIGQLHRIVATLNGERAMVFRNGTHIIDLICFFAESDPEWVMGALDASFDGYGPRYAGDGGHKPSTDPGVLGMVSFKNGVRALYQGSQNTVGYSGIDLVGSKGRIHIGIASHQFELYVQGADGANELLHKDFPRYHTTRG